MVHQRFVIKICAVSLWALSTPLAYCVNDSYIGPNQGLWRTDSLWSAGQFPNNTTSQSFDAVISQVAAITVQLDGSVAVNTLSLAAPDSLALLTGGGLTFSGNLFANSGTVIFNTGALNPTITFNSDAALSGGGSILFNSSSSKITGPRGISLTNDNAIAGQGSLTLLRVVNSGTITATTATLTLAPYNGVNGFTNTGILRADGGTLIVDGEAQYNNTGGLFDARNGSTIQLKHADVTGGTITSDSGSVIQVFSKSSLNSLATSALVDILSQQFVTISGNLVNSGTIKLSSANGLDTGISMVGTTTLSGHGTILLSNSTGNRFVGTTGGLLMSDNTFTGAGRLGTNAIRVASSGSIISTGAGLTIDPFDAPDGFVSTGILRADNAPLTLKASTYSISGTLESIHGGLLNFSAGSFTVTCPIVLADNSTVTFNATAQSVTSVTGLGSAAVGAGAVLVSDAITVSSLSISGSHTLRSGGTSASRVTALSLSGSPGAWTARLNLNDNKLIVQASDATDKSTRMGILANQIRAGYNNGNWLGNGITSSTVAADAAHYGVGLFDNAILGLSSFGGVASVNENSIFLSQALLGDANLNGIVDAPDLLTISSHWHTSAANWAAGDLNLDGFVDSMDVSIVINHWNAGTAFPSLFDYSPTFGYTLSVPEPGTLLLMVLGGITLRRRWSVGRARG